MIRGKKQATLSLFLPQYPMSPSVARRESEEVSMSVRRSVRLAIAVAAIWVVSPAAEGLAQSTPASNWVCPNGSMGGDASTTTYEAGCGLASGAPSAGGTSSGPPLTGAALRREMNIELRNGIANAAMQGAIDGFIGTMQRNAAAAAQQRQAFEQEMARRQQEAAEEQRIAEQQRVDAMFARLDSELKLSAFPFQLAMQGMDAPGPDDLHMKGMDVPGPNDLHMKIGDDSPTSTAYGIKGLPGIYVGGPAGGATTNMPDATGSNGTSSDASSSNPNLASGPGTGTTGQGIAGLPGTYLDGAQPSQAAGLAQAAQNLPAGPERDMTEDTALHAALHNPDLTSQTQDPQMQNFQKADLNYEQSLHTDTQASQNYAAAQAQVTSDQSAIATAKAQLASLQPTMEQQAALTNMLNVAKTNEAAAETARQIFENADVHLSMARTQATRALAGLPQSPSAPPINLSRNALSRDTTPALLRAQTPVEAYASAPGHPLAIAPAVTMPARSLTLQPVATPMSPVRAKICAQLSGAQDALRRLMKTQAIDQAGLTQWSDTVDKASSDAWKRGLEMAREYTGDKLTEYLGDLIKDSDQESEQIYLQISQEKDQTKVGALQQEWEKLGKDKVNLQETLEQVKRVGETTDALSDQYDNLSEILGADGKDEDLAEKIRELGGKFLRKDSVQEALGVSPEGSRYIKYAGSILDSSYDVLSEALAAQRIKQLNQNAEEFLQAQRALQNRIQATVAKLNADKQTSPPGEASCNMVAER